MIHEDQTEFYTCPLCGAGIGNDIDGCIEHDDCPAEADYIRDYELKDVVYILGSGSQWQDNELRYSLRSLEKHFKHRRVIIVGERPEWLQNVTHIAFPDGFANVKGGKYKNVIRKVREACLDERISEHFVLMNDDFYFLKDCDYIKPYTLGTLDSMINDFKQRYGDADGRNQYINALLRTKRFLNKAGIDNPMSYGVHYPIVYNKRKFVEMMNEIDWLEKPMSWRTLYGNIYQLGSIETKDFKLNRVEEIFEFTQRIYPGEFLSVSDSVTLNPKFQEWLQEQFPLPSIYEQIS